MTGKKICIQVGGGLGDQLCAEPVIRYMINHWCKNDAIDIITHYPEFFKHLPVQCHISDQQYSEPRLITRTHPVQGLEVFDQFIYFQQTHAVDYISFRLLRRTLPVLDKTPHIEINEEAKEKILHFLGDKINRTVLLHAGEGWTSKTFHTDTWDSYIEALKKAGYYVVLIGKDKRQFTSLADLDTRNKLTISELIALISVAAVLISNDSGPVHIAGAFDNWIGLIASCKDPSYVLPYRNGSVLYKARALEKYRAYDIDFNFNPIEYINIPIDNLSEDKLRATCPSPSEIVTFCQEVLPL